jgi:hypothetical protein
MNKLRHALVHLVLASLFAITLLIVLLDWAGGCGESFTYADGTTHLGECIGRDIFFSTIGVSK